MNRTALYRPGTVFLLLSALLQPVVAEVVTDGSMGPGLELTGPRYQIDAALGSQSGGNLFHSFSRFDIYTGESASFSGPATVENIIGRVTGGEFSWIDGLLESAIPGANLFLINPAGVVFGENARLDLAGSFYASTADSLHFSNGDRLPTGVSAGAILSTAPVSGFGFIGDMHAPLIVQGSRLLVAPGRTLGLSSGDMRIGGGVTGMVGGDAASLLLTSVSGEADVSLTGEVSRPADHLPRAEPAVLLIGNGAELNSGGESGGEIAIQGEQVIIDNARLYANTYGAEPGRGLRVQAEEFLEINNSALQSGTAGEGDAGALELTTPYLLLDNGSVLLTSSYSSAAGGDIRIRSDHSLIQGGSQILSQANLSGAAGDIRIEAGETLMIEGDPLNPFATRISSTGFASGDAGAIGLIAPDLSISAALIDSAAMDQGLGGDVQIQAGHFSLSDSAQIITSTSGGLSGGNVSIEAGEGIEISGEADAEVWTGIFATTTASGQAGVVSITAPSLTMAHAWIDAIASGSGDAGDINLTISGALAIENGRIRTSTMGEGDAGVLLIDADSLSLSDEAHLGAMSVDRGYAGDIIIRTRTLRLDTGGEISNESYYSSPGSGDIQVSASDWISISGDAEPKDVNPGGDRVSTGIFSFTGNLSVSAPVIEMERSGTISTRTHNDNHAGNLVILADRVQLLSGAQINADSFGSSGFIGLGGNILLTVGDSLVIDGQSAGRHSGITASTRSSGNAGLIDIRSPRIEIRNDGLINTSTGVFGEGSAGDIQIRTEELLLSNNGGILSSSVGYGDGGSILIDASGRVALETGSFISAYGYSSGVPGEVDITAGTLQLSDSNISTSSYGIQGAGDLQLHARTISLNDGSSVSSLSTENQVDAGTISIRADDIFASNDSSVSTEAEGGSGGNISIQAPTIRLIDAPVSATVAGGEGGGGNVVFHADAIGAVGESDITARADQGLGGFIQLNTDVFLRADSVDLDASSNVQGNDGVVEINAPEMDLSGSVNELRSDFLNVASLLDNRCIARAAGARSSLVIGGRSSLAPAPDDYLLGSGVGAVQTARQTEGVALDRFTHRVSAYLGCGAMR